MPGSGDGHVARRERSVIQRGFAHCGGGVGRCRDIDGSRSGQVGVGKHDIAYLAGAGIIAFLEGEHDHRHGTLHGKSGFALGGRAVHDTVGGEADVACRSVDCRSQGDGSVVAIGRVVGIIGAYVGVVCQQPQRRGGNFRRPLGGGGAIDIRYVGLRSVIPRPFGAESAYRGIIGDKRSGGTGSHACFEHDVVHLQRCRPAGSRIVGSQRCIL